MLEPSEESINEFKKRAQEEPDYCEELFQYATLRLLAAKYAYYELSRPYIDDMAYDILEKSWYVMGRALGHLKEDDTSPCIDFDHNHPMAKEAIELGEKLKK